MTVIAWDGKTLAADRLACTGGLKLTVTKIWRYKGALFGCAGELGVAMEMLAWYRRGAKVKDYPSSNTGDTGAGLLVIDKKGVWKYETGPYPHKFEDPFLAIGSGCECAMVAMACGRDARSAVELASKYISSCGHGVDTLTL